MQIGDTQQTPNKINMKQPSPTVENQGLQINLESSKRKVYGNNMQGNNTQLTADFLLETMVARGEWN